MSTPEKPTGDLPTASAEEDEFYRLNPMDFSWTERMLESSRVNLLENQGSGVFGNEYSLFGNHSLESCAISSGASSSWPMPTFRISTNNGNDASFSPWTGKTLESLAIMDSDSEHEMQKSSTLEPIGSSRSKANNNGATPMELEQQHNSFDLWYGSIWSPVARNDQSSTWPNPEVSVYVGVSTQYIGNVCFLLKGENDWNPAPSMKIQVLTPDGQEIPVKILKESGVSSSRRHFCAFRAHFPGFYTVQVSDVLLVNFKVKGSPLTIPVSRNYKIKSLMGIQLQPRVFLSQALKAWGIAYSTVSNRIYVTDREGHKVIIYHADGSLDKCFGKQGAKPEEFFRPTGVAVDNRFQRLIITDKDNHRVSIYTLEGAFIYTFGTKGFKNGEFNYPWGVAVSPKDSSIAVVDSRNHRVQLFDCNGNYLRKFSVFETNPFEYKTEFNFPRGITFDINGEDLYVTDFNVQAVFKLNNMLTQKTRLNAAGVNFARPQGITMDHVGNILVCDSKHNCIRVIGREGEHIVTISGHALESFTSPQDIAVVPTGEIIVIDVNSRIRVL